MTLLGQLQGALDVAAVVPGAVCHRGVTFAEPRGFRPLLLDLYVPADHEGPVPCVVWVHGGAWEYGDRRFTPDNWPPGHLFGALVGAGMAVATVDYRLSGEAVHPAGLEDVLAAVRYLRARAEVLSLDPARFGVAGESAGGHLAALVALLGSEDAAVQAAAVLYGVTDLIALDAVDRGPGTELEETPEARLLGGRPRELPDLAREASPVHHAHHAAPPMLLISGDADDVVPLAQSRALHDALAREGARDVVLEVVPGAGHCFWEVDPLPPLDTVVRFLADRLRA